MLSSNPPQPEDAWRRLGLQLAGFCLPIVLAWVALEWWATRVPNFYSSKRENLQTHANDVDTLIIGSSSVQYGIQPQLLSGSAFNLAAPAETLSQTDSLATRVVPGLPKLKRVIINISYVTLFLSRFPKSDDVWQYYYKQEWGILPEQPQDWVDCRMWSRLALRTPRFYLLRLAKSINSLIRHGRFAYEIPDNQAIDDRGAWIPKPQDAPDLSLEAAKSTLAQHHRLLAAEYEADNIAHLDHLLSMFRQRNINVDFVTMPVWHTYQEGIRPEHWDETQRVMAQRTNNQSVYYYSFLSAPYLEPLDFVNVDHLSYRGAARFTPLLDSALNQGKQRSGTKPAAPGVLISTNMSR